MAEEKTNLIVKFREYFEMVPADTEELKREVYKLRYQVYCIETGFENPSNFPDGMEWDAYDARSEHYLIRHIDSGQFAATARLILPDRSGSRGAFPINEHCKIEGNCLVDEIDQGAVAEVSRFCVSKNFKRRSGEQGTLASISSPQVINCTFAEEERRCFPFITVGLIACLVRMSVKHNLSYWYAVMEPALIRFLAHLGIYFTVIGPVTDYHGQRIPCVIKVDDLLAGVRQKNPPVWELLVNRENAWKKMESR
jgi:N-acyl amino acid synthase of PEP-CTERM/exosortase system